MLEKILQNKEDRAIRQKEIIALHKTPIVSVCVNIPGDKKLSDDAIFIYNQMTKKLEIALKDVGFKVAFTCKKDTGIEGIYSVDMNAKELKILTCKLENEEFLGRFIDFDVLDLDFKILSRDDFNLPSRKCFICQNRANICARSRKHSVKEMLDFISLHVKTYKQILSICKIAQKGMRVEVDLTPKPGLVDKNDSGSHKDMDRFTFYKSIDAIYPFLEKFVIIGYKKEDIFNHLRELGKECEKAMLRATNGVNTHKGMIFSLAVILGSIGAVLKNGEDLHVKSLHEKIKSTCKDLVKKDLTNKPLKSAGERYFAISKNAGIRQEAQNGYPNLFFISLPFYEKMLKNFDEDTALKKTLLKLISQIDDTTIYNRGDTKSVEYVKNLALKSLQKENINETLSSLNKIFIEKNLSPGGSADMLALTWILREIMK